MKAIPFPQANDTLKAPPPSRAEIQALIDKLTAEGEDMTEAQASLDAYMPADQEVYDLPIWRGIAHGANRLISCWEPSAEERALIAAGGPIWLWVVGHTHSPLVLDGANPFEPAGPVPDVFADWWSEHLDDFLLVLRERGVDAGVAQRTAEEMHRRLFQGRPAPTLRPTVAESFRELLDRLTLTPEEEEMVRRARKTASREAAQNGPGGQVEMLLAIIDRLTVAGESPGPVVIPPERDEDFAP